MENKNKKEFGTSEVFDFTAVEEIETTAKMQETEATPQTQEAQEIETTAEMQDTEEISAVTQEMNETETVSTTEPEVFVAEDYQKEPEDIFIDNVILNSGYSSEETPPKQEGRKKKSNSIFKKGAALIASAAVFGLVAGTCFQATRGFGTIESGGSSLEAKDEFGSSNGGLNLGDGNGDVDLVKTSNSPVTMSDVSSVVENVSPSIVAINCIASQTQYDYFGRGYNEDVTGSGSGIIIGQSEEEIYIATNNHVINGASSIEIKFDDDTTAPATIKGTEPSSDLAVVAVKLSDLSSDTKKNIKIATIGDSDTAKVGEMVIAIGNALGYGQSTTVGWISALNREVTVDGVTLNLLQTDAAINPGNSGGALLNARGELIGINSVKYADTDVEGIGYAIPISEAIPILNDLMNREILEESEMGYLGISGKDVTDDFSSSFNTPVGVYVYTVGEGSPAEEAGIQQGDIISEINGKTIKSMDELRRVLNYSKAGSEAVLKVYVLEQGNYVEKTVTVKLGKRPANNQ